MRGVAGINTSIDQLQCTADVCSVNNLSINSRESPLYSSATMHEVFLGGYSTLKNDYMTFYVRHVTCKCKKTFPLYIFCLYNTIFFVINGIFFAKLMHLGIFSIHNINLHNLKGNGNMIFIIIIIIFITNKVYNNAMLIDIAFNHCLE